jgi:hypothetical protein
MKKTTISFEDFLDRLSEVRINLVADHHSPGTEGRAVLRPGDAHNPVGARNGLRPGSTAQRISRRALSRQGGIKEMDPL